MDGLGDGGGGDDGGGGGKNLSAPLSVLKNTQIMLSATDYD
jgi:hypothetical protein